MEVARRDTGEKAFIPADQIVAHVQGLLNEMQEALFNAAKDRMTTSTREVNSWEEFTAGLEEGGFLSAHWDGTDETEELIKKETKATIRCLPLNGDTTPARASAPAASARRALRPRLLISNPRPSDCFPHMDTNTPIGLDAQATAQLSAGLNVSSLT